MNLNNPASRLFHKLTDKMKGKEHNDVLLGFVASLGSRVAAAAVQFLQSVIFSRILGVEALGIYFFATSVYRVGEALAQVGIPPATIRQIATYRATGAWHAIRALSLYAVTFAFGLGLIASLTIWLMSGWIAQEFYPGIQAERALGIVAWAVIPGLIGIALGSVLRGLGRQAIANLMGTMMVSMGAIIAFWSLTRGAGSAGAVTAFLIGQISSCIGLAVAVFFSSRQPTQDARKAEPALLFRSSVPLWAISIASLGNDSIGSIALGLLGTPADVGVFGVATRMAIPMMFIALAVQSASEPKLAASSSLGNSEALTSAYRYALRLGGMVAFGGAVAMFALIRPMIALFGPEFASAALPYSILIAGGAVMIALSPAGSMLVMAGHSKPVAWVSLASLPILIILLMLLVPVFGGTGAAIATAAIFAFRAIGQALIADKVIRNLASASV